MGFTFLMPHRARYDGRYAGFAVRLLIKRIFNSFAAMLLISIGSFAQTAYITNGNDNTVSVINVTTNSVIATIPVGNTPEGVSVSQDGSKVYVANHNAFTVSVINTATNTVVATIPVGSSPPGLSVSPDGTKVYVANYGGNTVSVI